MIEKHCFNYNKTVHIVKNCSKLKMIKINEIVKKKFDKKLKKIFFIKIAIKKIITILFMNLNLFDNNSTIVKCILKTNIKSKS